MTKIITLILSLLICSGSSYADAQSSCRTSKRLAVATCQKSAKLFSKSPRSKLARIYAKQCSQKNSLYLRSCKTEVCGLVKPDCANSSDACIQVLYHTTFSSLAELKDAGAMLLHYGAC